MKRLFKKLLILLLSALIIYAGVFLTARYGWKLFSFQYCNPSAVVLSATVGEGVINITGDTADSMSSYVGYTYRIVGDRLFVGVKHNMFFGFFRRQGAFNINLKTDVTKINHIYLKYSDNQSEIWNRYFEKIQDEIPDTDFNLPSIKKITVFDTSEFDGNLVKDGRNIKLNTMDSQTAQKFVGSADYKRDMVFWKGYFFGIIQNEIETRNMKISNYGGFFSIDGIEGYFEIAAKHREEWDKLVSDFSYNSDVSNFIEYNEPISPFGENDSMGHLYLFFPNEETFTLCMCRDIDFITTEKIRKFLKWKYDSGVKLLKYLHTKEPRDNIKLIFEDGTYFEWDYYEYTKYLCEISS